MFNWFNAKAAEKFGGELGDFFVSRYAIIKNQKNLVAKRDEMINQMFKNIDSFKEKETLNIYKKAKLSNTFKWKLLNAGYDSKFVSEITLLIIRYL